MFGDYVCVGKQTFDLESINDWYGYEPEYGKKLLEALREEKPKFVPYVFNVFGGRVSMDKFDEEFVLYATEAIDSDNKCIRMRKVMDLDPSQEEFSYALDELIQKVETRDSDD